MGTCQGWVHLVIEFWLDQQVDLHFMLDLTLQVDLEYHLGLEYEWNDLINLGDDLDLQVG